MNRISMTLLSTDNKAKSLEGYVYFRASSDVEGEFNIDLLKLPSKQLLVPLTQSYWKSSYQFCSSISYCPFLLPLPYFANTDETVCIYVVYITDCHAFSMSYSAISPPTCHFWDNPDILFLKV